MMVEARVQLIGGPMPRSMLIKTPSGSYPRHLDMVESDNCCWRIDESTDKSAVVLKISRYKFMQRGIYLYQFMFPRK